MLRIAATLSLLLLAQTDALAIAMQRPADSQPADGRRVLAPTQKKNQKEEKDGERKPGPATLDEAIEIALKRYGGTAAGAETVEREGQRVHEVRVLLDNGSVRTVRIDPRTGAIIPQKR